MPSLEFETNTADIIKLVYERLEGVNIKEMTALQASTAIGELRKRIHVDGKDSNDGQIGTYDPEYIKVRTGVYSDSKISKKIHKEQSNLRTKKKKEIQFNRSADPKVILSLTRQMESDMVIVPLENGCGVGYTNEDNFLKSQHNEKIYKKKIFNLTLKEREKLFDIGQEYINETIK